MIKKNTLAATRIKQELNHQDLSGADLSRLTAIPYPAIANILAGRSTKVEKMEAIAKSLGKPLMYFYDVDYDQKNNKKEDAIYDGELHYKVVKIINDLCKKNSIRLTKQKMDDLVNFIYPRLKKDDPQDLIKSQTEALLSYALNKKA